MAKPVDLELKKAFLELQSKMVETTKKVQMIQSQITGLKQVNNIVCVTKKHLNSIPQDTRCYETTGRMFVVTDKDIILGHLDDKETAITGRITDLSTNREYLEKNLKESEDNIREMLQQKKDQVESKS